MFKRKMQQLGVALALVTALGLMVPAVALADAPEGTGPNTALAPTSAMQHLNVGQERWYAFHSAGADRDDNPSKVLITLAAQPDGSAQFNIWSTERLRAQAVADNPRKDAGPVGSGTKQAYKDGDNTLYRNNGELVWVGGFMQPATFYVQVQQVGSRPADYALSITGDAVTFPTAVPSTNVALASAQNPPVVLPATGNLAAPAGSSLSTAMSVTGQQMTLTPGQAQWYRVQVPGTRDDEAKPTILARLNAQPGGAAKFTVWTEERLRQRAIASNPNKDAPGVGMGTVEKFADGDTTVARFGGDLIWKGDARKAGTYYIVVEPAGSSPVTYRLSTTITQ